MLRLNYRRRLRQTGDTIVEVMVVLAILGLALGISYATANRSLLNARQAQENSTATELAQSQIENIFNYVSSKNAAPSGMPSYFCFDSSNNITPAITNPAAPPAACQSGSIPYDMVVANCDAIGITTAPCQNTIKDSDTFIVTATWPDVLGQGTDTVSLAYRIHVPITAASPGGGNPGGGNPGGGDPNQWSWLIAGLYYDTSGQYACKAGDPVNNEDQANWTPINENGCDPLGPLGGQTNPPSTTPCYGYTDTNGAHSINSQQPSTANPYMFARRDFTATYDINNIHAVSTGNVAGGGAANLTISYNEYAGATDTPPPAGFLSSKETTTPSPSPAYAFVVYVYVINAQGAVSNATVATLTPASGTASYQQTFTVQPITLPANAKSIQIAWINNEEDQDGNDLCTPNAPGYDPDLQINSIELTSS